VLAIFILAAHGDKTSTPEKCLLFALTAFAAASHSATLAVLLGLCCVGWIARPFLRGRISVAGLTQGSLGLVAGAAMLLAANFALSGQLAWTPGGYGVAFGRMLQDGIVAQYLRDHCPQQKLKLCPYRDQLPATADQFLTRMFRANPDFVFTVTRDFVKSCQTPVLVLPDDTAGHSYAVAVESAMLAPKGQLSMYPWKDTPAKIPLAVRHVRSFLLSHRTT